MCQVENLELRGDVGQLIKGELIGASSPHTPRPMSPLLPSESRSRIITVTLLAKRTRQSAWSAKASAPPPRFDKFISLKCFEKDIHIKSVVHLASL